MCNARSSRWNINFAAFLGMVGLNLRNECHLAGIRMLRSGCRFISLWAKTKYWKMAQFESFLPAPLAGFGKWLFDRERRQMGRLPTDSYCIRNVYYSRFQLETACLLPSQLTMFLIVASKCRHCFWLQKSGKQWQLNLTPKSMVICKARSM